MDAPEETLVVLAKLRKFREAQGLSQFQVAQRMNRPRSAVWTLEAGKHDPHLLTFILYLRALGLRLSCEVISTSELEK
jgi:transcriptional regulator with XRE-family HTH domain